MNPVIISTYPAIAYSVPVGIWFFGQTVILGAEGLPYEKVAVTATHSLALLQLLFAILYVPGLCLSGDWKATLPVTVINICIPLPIYLMTWLMGYNTLSYIFSIQAFVLCVGILLIPITNGLAQILWSHKVFCMLLSSMQIVLAGLVWINRDIVFNWYV